MPQKDEAKDRLQPAQIDHNRGCHPIPKLIAKVAAPGAVNDVSPSEESINVAEIPTLNSIIEIRKREPPDI
ncbi:MAG: hypothetical protein H7345_13650 [Rubritepida sp.]|nr:hypothetical protein [Rubritepida sp.]